MNRPALAAGIVNLVYIQWSTLQCSPTDDEDPHVCQGHCPMSGTVIQHFGTRREGSLGWIKDVNFIGDQHSAVWQKRHRVVRTRDKHRRRQQCKGLRGWIECLSSFHGH